MVVSGSMSADEALARLRDFASMLPEVAEVVLLGSPALRVATNTFVAFEERDGSHVITFKLATDRQRAVVDGERYVEALDRGEHGWTSARIDRPLDWDELDELIVASYRLVAPDWCQVELDALLGEP